MTLATWTASGDGEPAPMGTSGAVTISAAGIQPGAGSGTGRDSVLVLPQEVVHDFVAVAIVPDALHGHASRNGLPLEAGMQLLVHSDRIDLSGWTLWVSGDGAPDEVPYDEAVHGAGQFCLRTKAPLRAGDPVVRCPGTRSKPCGMLYRADAWRLQLPCPACGWDPKQPAWRPA